MSKVDIKEAIKQKLIDKLKADQWDPKLVALDKYSARESARKLVEGMELAIGDG